MYAELEKKIENIFTQIDACFYALNTQNYYRVENTITKLSQAFSSLKNYYNNWSEVQDTHAFYINYKENCASALSVIKSSINVEQHAKRLSDTLHDYCHKISNTTIQSRIHNLIPKVEEVYQTFVIFVPVMIDRYETDCACFVATA